MKKSLLALASGTLGLGILTAVTHTEAEYPEIKAAFEAVLQ